MLGELGFSSAALGLRRVEQRTDEWQVVSKVAFSEPPGAPHPALFYLFLIGGYWASTTWSVQGVELELQPREQLPPCSTQRQQLGTSQVSLPRLSCPKAPLPVPSEGICPEEHGKGMELTRSVGSQDHGDDSEAGVLVQGQV